MGTFTGLGSRDIFKRFLFLAIAGLACGNALALAVHDEGLPSLSAAPATPRAKTAALATEMPTAPLGPTTSRPAVAKSKESKGSSTPTTAASEQGNPIHDTFPVSSQGYDYELALSPSCARPGETLTAVLKLKPKWGSAGTFMPFYADGSYEKGAGEIAKQDGSVTYSWVARPVTGEGRLVTQARDADSGEYGTKVVAFRIVEATQSC